MYRSPKQAWDPSLSYLNFKIKSKILPCPHTWIIIVTKIFELTVGKIQVDPYSPLVADELYTMCRFRLEWLTLFFQRKLLLTVSVSLPCLNQAF